MSKKLVAQASFSSSRLFPTEMQLYQSGFTFICLFIQMRLIFNNAVEMQSDLSTSTA